MSYDLKAVNEDAGYFSIGAFSWPILLEQFGYLYPHVHKSGRYCCLEHGGDGRRFECLATNDGFKVSAEESVIMARMARNFVAIQRTLPEENRPDGPRAAGTFTRENIAYALQQVLVGTVREPWPEKIRDDFVDKFERFADWAEKSGGFEIW